MFELFLEDGDLLENVNISNEINNLDILDEYISESDMMIALYEHQRFMIEQDTHIFMELNYEVVNEGVLKKIGDAIMHVINKIKELITKFINFITGKRKEENKEESFEEKEENVEKVSEEIKEKSKKSEATSKEVVKAFEEFEKNLDKYTADDWKKDIQQAKDTIEKTNTSKSYIPITIHKDVMRSINISEKWTEIEKLIDTAEEMVGLIKQRKQIDDQLEKYNNFVPLSGNVRSSKNEKDNKSIFVDTNNLCDRETYFSKYYRDAKVFFRNYTDTSKDNIKYLKDILDKRIKPLEREVKSIITTISKDDSYKKTVTKLQTIVTGLSQACLARISSLTEIEKAYQAYVKNIITTYSHKKTVDLALKDIETYQKNIDRLSDKTAKPNQKDVVQEYIDKKDAKGLKYIFVDSLDLDPTFKQYERDYRKVLEEFPEAFEDHKELTPFIANKAKWTEDYWTKLKMDFLKNPSTKRLNHMRIVAKVFLAEKITRLEKERAEQGIKL